MYRLHFTFDESAIWMMHFGKDVECDRSSNNRFWNYKHWPLLNSLSIHKQIPQGWQIRHPCWCWCPGLLGRGLGILSGWSSRTRRVTPPETTRSPESYRDTSNWPSETMKNCPSCWVRSRSRLAVSCRTSTRSCCRRSPRSKLLNRDLLC